jgi:putative ABC transport system ATP-binding protein
MVELEKVVKHYGAGVEPIRALDGLSLSIASGAFAIVTGPSGSGKTTLLNIIAGLTRPDSGKVRVFGREVLSMPDAELSRFRAEEIGFVFQFQSMLPTLTALENVILPLRFVKGKDGGAERAMELLDKVGLAGRAGAYARELSEGQKRRVCIARALINQPSLLLCDEPTGDLDPETESSIMQIIAGVNNKGATVVMTTHNHELRSFASRALTLEFGHLKD